MSLVTLPDGRSLSFESPVTLETVAAQIGPGLLKASLAAVVRRGDQSETWDLCRVLPKGAAVELRFLTDKDPESLEIVRHSAAHILAQAVKRLFPTAQVTIGPVIEDGFFYDFAFERPFTTDDLSLIEAEMVRIVDSDYRIKRHEWSREDAVQKFKSMGEDYKVEILNAIPSTEILSFYEQGEFLDLCRGPHAPSTGRVKAFKLIKVAGAYWRGDAKNPMLQRIYGTAWHREVDLKAYLTRLEEAEKRDHRKLGKRLDWFHIQEEAPGMVFWHPKGWAVYQVIEQYMRARLLAEDYKEVRTPQVLHRRLWERSGHWEKFQGNMFLATVDGSEDHAIKPMNCPGHVQIFNQGLRSYKDLPLRLAEFGACHRNEPSGALHGLMRVRQFVQDDAHIFCTEAQIQSEVARFIHLLFDVYKDFGFETILIKLATRPKERVGEEALWDKAEQALSEALEEAHLEWTLSPGEGAFYGPKVEFSLKDCIGRVWQCGTIQVDFSMPDRLGAEYVGEDGRKHTPVMLHRAILGSLERFVGILMEETAGRLPVWLAPVQVAVLTITDKQNSYAAAVAHQLRAGGLRVTEDLRNEKIGFKIRERTLERVPYLVVVGEREVTSGALRVRTEGGADLGSFSVDQFLELVREACAKRSR